MGSLIVSGLPEYVTRLPGSIAAPFASSFLLLVPLVTLLTPLTGMDHPEVAQALNNVGTSLANQGRHAEAEATFR